MTRRKPYFAQDNHQHPNHRAKYFWTLEEAQEWLLSRGGGTVNKRNAAVVYINEESVRVWAEVLNV